MREIRKMVLIKEIGTRAYTIESIDVIFQLVLIKRHQFRFNKKGRCVFMLRGVFKINVPNVEKN